MNLNRAMLIGNLTRDPEVRKTPSGQSVANFSIATNRVWNGNDGQKQTAVDYHNIVAWGKLADICSQYLRKGKKVYVEGRLQTRDWEGQDGVKRSRTEIVLENMIMLDSARGESSSRFGETSGYQRPQPSNEPSVEPINGPQNNSDDEIKVEDIPF
ncbi:MAG: single-stranded DNA-binding protein [Patescibacteria group bacterium]